MYIGLGTLLEHVEDPVTRRSVTGSSFFLEWARFRSSDFALLASSRHNALSEGAGRPTVIYLEAVMVTGRVRVVSPRGACLNMPRPPRCHSVDVDGLNTEGEGGDSLSASIADVVRNSIGDPGITASGDVSEPVVIQGIDGTTTPGEVGQNPGDRAITQHLACGRTIIAETVLHLIHTTTHAYDPVEGRL